MHSIDKLGFSSLISRVDPKGKLVFSLLPMILCLMFDSVAVSMLTIVLMGAVTIRCNPQVQKNYLKFMMIPSGFLLIGTIGILVNRYELSQSMLIGFHTAHYNYGVSTSSLFTGFKLIVRAMSAVSCMYFLSFNTPMLSLFQVLRNTKLPDVIVSLMELIYHYIFVIWEEADRMKTAQHSRLGNCDFRTSVKATGAMMSSLFIRTYQRCDRAYAALESRGYDGAFDSLTEEYEPCKTWYLYTALLCAVLLTVGIFDKLY